jgi:hypothetical protein
MKMKRELLFLGLYLVAGSAFGGETVASFAKQTLGLDLASVPFGMIAGSNSDYKMTESPTMPSPFVVDPKISWKTNAASAKYARDFPNRTLRYAFRDGQLVAIRITISAFTRSGSSDSSDTAQFEQRRKELVRIQEELLKASPIQKLNFEDGGFRVQYGASCGPTPESLLISEIEITRTNPK